MPRIRSYSVLPLAMTTLLLLGGCSSLYDQTKGWGVDLWEGVKKGSAQAANATKEALDSANNSSDNADTERTSTEIETSSLAPMQIKGPGNTSTPAPLKSSEKMALPPEGVTKGKYAVHLSSNKSKQSAEREWTELTNAFPKEMKGLTLQIRSVNISGKGKFYRVLGTGYDTKSAAKKACDLFKKKKQYCASLKL